MICNVLSTLLLVSITLATKTSSAPFTQCIGDGECNEGQYCHFRPGVPVGLCQECKDCQRYYYRHSGTRNTCAKNSNYCGECLDGYFDVLTSDGSKAERCTRHHNRIRTTQSGLSKSESSSDPSTNKLVMIIGLLSVAVAFLVAVSCIVYLLHVQNKCFWNDDDDKNDSLDEIQTEEGQSDELLNNNNCLVQDDNRVIQDPPMMVVATCEAGKPNKAGCWQVPSYLRATLLRDVQDVNATAGDDQPLNHDSGYPTTTANSRDDLNALNGTLNTVNTRSLERRLSNRLSTAVQAANTTVATQNPGLNSEDSQSDPSSGSGTPDPSSYSRSGSRQEETHFWVDMISVRRSHKVSESFH